MLLVYFLYRTSVNRFVCDYLSLADFCSTMYVTQKILLMGQEKHCSAE